MGLLPRLPAGRRGAATTTVAATATATATTTIVVRFLVCIMSEMEISFHWAKSCMFRDMRSVFCVEWGGKPLELEQQSEQQILIFRIVSF